MWVIYATTTVFSTFTDIIRIITMDDSIPQRWILQEFYLLNGKCTIDSWMSLLAPSRMQRKWLNIRCRIGNQTPSRPNIITNLISTSMRETVFADTQPLSTKNSATSTSLLTDRMVSLFAPWARSKVFIIRSCLLTKWRSRQVVSRVGYRVWWGIFDSPHWVRACSHQSPMVIRGLVCTRHDRKEPAYNLWVYRSQKISFAQNGVQQGRYLSVPSCGRWVNKTTH